MVDNKAFIKVFSSFFHSFHDLKRVEASHMRNHRRDYRHKQNWFKKAP